MAATAISAAFSSEAQKRDVLHLFLKYFASNCQYDEEELLRALQRIVTATIRGASTGFVLRGGLYLLGEVFTLALRPAGRVQRRRVSVRTTASDTARYTAFLGSLAGVFVAVDEGIAAVLGKQRTASWRALVAGACAGPTLLLTGSKEQHYSLATYVLLRGIILLIRSGNKADSPAWLHALLKPTRLEHGDTWAMCAACCQILYSYTMMPTTLPSSYVRFINKVAGKEQHVWETIRALARRRSHSPSSTRINSSIPCEVLHPGQTCSSHAVSRLVTSYPRMLRVYIPVYVLPAILVHRRKLLEQPRKLGLKVALGTMRSSLFLSAFLALGFGAACTLHQTMGHSRPAFLALAGGVGGLAVLAEKKSRRMELAVFCMARALEAFSLCLLKWGCIKDKWIPSRLDVALFSCGCAALFHCYSDSLGQHRDVFRSKYLNVLDFILGNSGLQAGSIQHVPSNMDLLRVSMSRGKTSSQSTLDDVCNAAAAELSATQLHGEGSQASPDVEDGAGVVAPLTPDRKLVRPTIAPTSGLAKACSDVV